MDQDHKPRVLANKVLLQMIQHSVSEKLAPSWEDFMALRVVFRRCGGSWRDLLEGDHQQLDLLRTIVVAWGHMPARQLELKRMV